MESAEFTVTKPYLVFKLQSGISQEEVMSAIKEKFNIEATHSSNDLSEYMLNITKK